MSRPTLPIPPAGQYGWPCWFSWPSLVLARAAYLQITRHEPTLEAQAENNHCCAAHRAAPGPDSGPQRHCTGHQLHKPTLEITPSRVDDVDAVIEELGQIIDIQVRDKRRFKRLREESAQLRFLPIRTRLTDEEVARYGQPLPFSGVEIKARLFRQYPMSETASHGWLHWVASTG